MSVIDPRREPEHPAPPKMAASEPRPPVACRPSIRIIGCASVALISATITADDSNMASKIIRKPAQLIGAETAQSPSSGNVEPVVMFPEDGKAVIVRAELAKELAGGYAPGTKVDVWLIPTDGKPTELALSGVPAISKSTVYLLIEEDKREGVCLVLNPEQINQLMAVEMRGTWRIAPAARR
ncbi:hypothetical protein [Zavarzinella formosa]|uniref:hypothetical protein n=1 Tax=Zavarzinella formosa TaxID=360055 RepID=UPI0012F8312A|nr:hypothetical protein [Zavarzinella formosa]